jgi:hypothetical protein
LRASPSGSKPRCLRHSPAGSLRRLVSHKNGGPTADTLDFLRFRTRLRRARWRNDGVLLHTRNLVHTDVRPLETSRLLAPDTRSAVHAVAAKSQSPNRSSPDPERCSTDGKGISLLKTRSAEKWKDRARAPILDASKSLERDVGDHRRFPPSRDAPGSADRADAVKLPAVHLADAERFRCARGVQKRRSP